MLVTISTQNRGHEIDESKTEQIDPMGFAAAQPILPLRATANRPAIPRFSLDILDADAPTLPQAITVTVYSMVPFGAFSRHILDADAAAPCASSFGHARCGVGTVGRLRADNQTNHRRIRSRSAPRQAFHCG